MKFNMGCGRRKMAGYINVDSVAQVEPDEIWDLEVTPWPWATSCAEEIVFNHSLEHLGADPKVFLEIMQQIYRIGAPGSLVRINVPHPRHDHFISDPTHVRAITAGTLRMFDRQLNEKTEQAGAANTPLALYTGVDFRLATTETVLESDYWAKLKAGEISQETVEHLVRTGFNIAKELRFVLEVRKAA